MNRVRLRLPLNAPQVQTKVLKYFNPQPFANIQNFHYDGLPIFTEIHIDRVGDLVGASDGHVSKFNRQRIRPGIISDPHNYLLLPGRHTTVLITCTSASTT